MNSDSLKQFQSLPLILQDAILSEETYSSIKDAINLANLEPAKQDEYFEKISDIVSDILFLQKYYLDFPKELRDRCPEIPESKINIISNIVQQKIFEPIKLELERTKQKELLNEQINQLRHKDKLPSSAPSVGNISSLDTQATDLKKAINEPPLPPSKTENKDNLNTEIPIPDLPEIPEITIQRPINPMPNLKKVEVPNVSQEKQEEIRNRLLEVIGKKDTKHKIVDTLKDVIKTGIKSTPVNKTEKQAVEVSTNEIPKIISNNSETQPETGKENSSNIFGVKLKEDTLEPKTPPLPSTSEPIKYTQQKDTNPFGEA